MVTAGRVLIGVGAALLAAAAAFYLFVESRHVAAVFAMRIAAIPIFFGMLVLLAEQSRARRG